MDLSVVVPALSRACRAAVVGSDIPGLRPLRDVDEATGPSLTRPP
jgi:hypothetical protein